jgi:hypothetical protein
MKKVLSKVSTVNVTLSPVAYFPTVTLVKTSGGKTCLLETSSSMMSLLISSSLHLSVKPSRLNTDICYP